MKKIAVLLTVLTAFSLIFSACTASPAGEETTAEETTLAPANGTEETLTEDVFAGTEEAQNTTENAEESIFYVG
ncbi:MAG: hypothetical protein J6A97_02440 [Clostridia bacterium]|nr:hypothetical protein [Clostridia bacterium]